MPWKPVPTATGAWWLPQNVTADRYYFDQPFAQLVVNLARRKAYRSLLDVGAGVGKYVHFYRTYGLEAYGIDGLNYAHERSGGLVEQVDLTGESDWCNAVDIVACMEVLEHIPKNYEARVIEQLVCSAKHRLVLSWAGPNQQGNGHVNLQSAAYVHAVLWKQGWREEQNETLQLRKDSSLPWYRSNVIGFVKQNAS